MSPLGIPSDHTEDSERKAITRASQGPPRCNLDKIRCPNLYVVARPRKRG